MRNLKKVIALVAVFAMLVSTVAFAASFKDVAETDANYEAIETLNKLGIITGDDEDNDGVMDFRPNDTITRAEVAVIISRIQGVNNASQQDTVFTDVPSSHWASGYIANAAGLGIVNGYGDGNFGPEDNVKYEEVIKMLMVTLGYEPFAKDKGGYPTGYVSAAQRYGVLDGVSGGAMGQEAPRGLVAAMVYNAIDTPLMDRYTFGTSDGSYIIYDGTNGYARQTLMSRDLKISKLRGIVTANTVSNLSNGLPIDTSAEQKITLSVLDNYDDDTNYEIGDYPQFKVGESDADEYLGYQVMLYAQDNKDNDDATIVSITEASGKNTKAEFTLDQFDSYEGGYLKYMKNNTDRTATKLNVSSSSNEALHIIYNNIATSDSITDLFGDNDDTGLITKNTTLSGRVTVLDNDNDPEYDVIYVEVAATGVVDELNDRGQLSFKNEVGLKSTDNAVRKIEFETSNTDTKINITKDGKPFDYKELKAWDVLTIITNNESENYDIRVISETAVTGTISTVKSSDTSASGSSYVIDGKEYDVAEGCYPKQSFRAGEGGTFYVDEFGKIVAYDKKNINGGGSTSDKYAYILNASTQEGQWNGVEITVQLLNKDGSVWNLNFASTVTFENLGYNATVKGKMPVTIFDNDDPKTVVDDDVLTYKVADSADKEAQSIVDALKGQLITYSSTNNNSEIKTITLAADEGLPEDNSSTLTSSGLQNGSYDEENMSFKKADLNEDTVVFFIRGNNGDISMFDVADKDLSSVGTAAEVAESDDYDYVVYDVDDNGYASAVVIYNTDGGISPSSAIAYITSIGKASVDDETVYSVTYYDGTNLKTSYTDPDMTGDEITDKVVAGSVYKFNMKGDTIKSAKKYLTFDTTVRDEISASDSNKTKIPGMPNVDSVAKNNGDEEIFFGPVVEKKSSGKITIAPINDANGGLSDLSKIATYGDLTTETINLGNSDTRYYLYDPALPKDAKFDIGAAGDINSIKGSSADFFAEGTTIVDRNGKAFSKTPAFGMMDYVFVRKYNNRVEDVVIYLAYEYDYDLAD